MRPVLTLSNGVEIPWVGLGTFRSKGQNVRNAVKYAITAGTNHIDTASIYKNEEDIAAALKELGVPRSEVFLTSKVSPYEQGTEKAEKACREILQRLDTSYVDLVLVHWPGVARRVLNSPLHQERRKETWRVLEDFHRQGYFRAIGVSNYTPAHLEDLLSYCQVKPVVNQVELHPRRQERDLRTFCERAGIAVVAYASLGCGDLLTHPIVNQVAAHCGRTCAQVLLKWALQEGCPVIPKSTKEDRVREAAAVNLMGWELAKSDMELLAGLEDGHKYCWDASSVA